MERIARDLEAFAEEASTFVRGLKPKKSRATLVFLSGELGAGKTAFVKAAAKTLGVGEDITSPTFVLMKTYALPGGQAFKNLIHIDAYRLENAEDLKPLRFDEYRQEADNLIMLEWPEKVANTVLAPDARIGIETLADGTRKLTYA